MTIRDPQNLAMDMDRGHHNGRGRGRGVESDHIVPGADSGSRQTGGLLGARETCHAICVGRQPALDRDTSRSGLHSGASCRLARQAQNAVQKISDEVPAVSSIVESW